MVATEGEEMHITALLVTNESLRHGIEDTPLRCGPSEGVVGVRFPPRSENLDLGHPVFSLLTDWNLGHPPSVGTKRFVVFHPFLVLRDGPASALTVYQLIHCKVLKIWEGG
jgi:hypothetical protein